MFVYRHNTEQNTIPEGIEKLRCLALSGHKLVPHNGIDFDWPAILKIVPTTFTAGDLKVIERSHLDTIVATRLIWPDLWDIDAKLVLRGVLPGNMRNRHSLQAWGCRLKVFKGDYEGDPAIADEKERKRRKWESWNQSMEDYCIQDTVSTLAILERVLKENYSEEALDLEMKVRWIISRQERRGFAFDEKAALVLYQKLVKRKLELESELKQAFRPRWVRKGKEMTPKRDNKTLGYVKDAVLQPVTLMEFNPGSRDHIAGWLKWKYSWVAKEFTDDGSPKLDEAVLSKMPYPEAVLLKEYLLVIKRCGALYEGKEAWVRAVRNGRIYGRVVTNGAVTGRMTHMKPNMAQVPASYSPYGHECRALFGAFREGWVLVGADAAALELRDFAGYLAKYDGGAYIRTVLEGDKKLGTDIHSVNARALGLDPKGTYFDGESGRDIAKTWFYAFLYGAGGEKLGFILTRQLGRKAVKAGNDSKDVFLKALPALAKLIKAVAEAATKRGFLLGLDGRRLKVRLRGRMSLEPLCLLPRLIFRSHFGPRDGCML